MVQVTVNVDITKQGVITKDILVEHVTTKEIGIVTATSKRYAHVTWLCSKLHNNSHHRRQDLIICPIGTKVTIKQRT